jgi:hypothetical protein
MRAPCHFQESDEDPNGLLYFLLIFFVGIPAFALFMWYVFRPLLKFLNWGPGQ